MPRQYSHGGRASAPPAHANATPPSKSMRERLGALRNLPPFLKLVWQTSPWMTVSNLALRMLRAVLPVLLLYVGKLIIDEVVGLSRSGALPGA